jgi:tripeptidyl-peptidase-2
MLRIVQFEATEVKRFFVVPPAGATWMDVTIRDRRVASEDGGSSMRLFVLHTVQMIPHAAYRDFAEQKYLNLSPSQTSVTSIPIEAGITTEVDIGRFWSAAGVTKADVSIEFRGIRPVPSEVSMNSGDYFSLVRMHSELQDEVINPSAKLTKWKTPVRPKSEGVITPLGERDIQPWNEKKTYQLLLTYEFTQDEKGSFIPRAPALQEVLYEASYDSQIMLVFDGDKKYLGYSDAFPHLVTAPKGTVVIRMQVRHDDPVMLEKINDMTIWIERKMDKEISLSAYETRESLLVNGKRTMRKRTLRKGACASVFFTEPPTSKLPSTCRTGDVLMGTAYYGSGESSLPGEGKRPNGFPLSYTVGPKMDKPSSDPDVPEPKDERTAEERMKEAIRDIKVDQLGKLTSSEKESGKFEELYAALEAEYSDHVPLLMSSLKYIDSHKKRSDMLEKLVAAADKVIAQISEDELALHFGKMLDKEDPEKVKVNKEMEKKKGFLIEALARKGLAIAEMNAEDATAKFDEVLSSLKAWVDIDVNCKHAALALERDCRAGRHGAALKRINKLLTKPGKESNGGVKKLTKAELFEKRYEIFEKLGYGALASRDKAMRLIASPKDYPLF